MRQVGVGGKGMDGEGRAGGMVRMGGVAGGWRRKKVCKCQNKTINNFSTTQ